MEEQQGKETKYSIYAIKSPLVDDLMYVGRTVQTINQRLCSHVGHAVRHNAQDKKSIWIRELLSNGLKPEIILLESGIKVSERQTKESYYIELIKPCLNMREASFALERSHCKLWTASNICLLGKKSDSELAKIVGLTRKAVSYQRISRGISVFSGGPKSIPPPMGGWNKIIFPSEFISALGTKPDYIIANQFNVNKTTVGNHRKSLGIECYAKTTGNNGCYKKGNYPERWK